MAIDPRGSADLIAAAVLIIAQATRLSSVRRIVEGARSPKRFLRAVLMLETRLRQETGSSEVIWPVLEILASPDVRLFVSQAKEGTKLAGLSKRAKERAKRRKADAAQIWTLAERGKIGEAGFESALADVRAHAEEHRAAGEYRRWDERRRKAATDALSSYQDLDHSIARRSELAERYPGLLEVGPQFLLPKAPKLNRGEGSGQKSRRKSPERFSVDNPSRSTAFGEHVLTPLLREIRKRKHNQYRDNLSDSETATLCTHWNFSGSRNWTMRAARLKA